MARRDRRDGQLLGRALAYRGFEERGFEVVALLDGDPRLLGEDVAGKPVRPMSDLPGLVADDGLAIGVIATPPSGAQDACDRLVKAGVRSVLNFAPAVLAVPTGSSCATSTCPRNFRILAFHGQRVAAAEVAPTPEVVAG